MINHQSGDSVVRQWENSRWNHIFTYVFHLALHRSGALSSCPLGLIPSCFIDASLCFQLTRYQHLVSKNSLVRTSIIQPSLPKGQAERDKSIGRHAGAGGIICQCVCVCVCVAVFCGGLNKVVEGDWTLWVGQWKGSQADRAYCGEQQRDAVLWDKMLKFSSKCVRRWSNTRRHDGVGVIALLKIYSKTNTQ